MTDERRIDRMTGCVTLGRIILWPILIYYTIRLLISIFTGSTICRSDTQRLQTHTVIHDMLIAMQGFHAEYKHPPISELSTQSVDSKLRSHGPMLAALMGIQSSTLNPKQIRFVEFPLSQNSKHGLLQDGDEWILNDLWGEPYYIVLDSNGDHVIDNPEFRASNVDPKNAQKISTEPPSAKLERDVLIYSSGQDRDPKTWHDNICSWRQ